MPCSFRQGCGCCEKKNLKVSEYLEKLNSNTENIKSFRCDIEYAFDQTSYGSTTKRSGVMYYQRRQVGSGLRINFSSLIEDENPVRKYKDEYVFDGRWLSHIDYPTKQVKKYEQVKKGETIDAFDLLSRRFPIIGFSKVEEIENDFEISVVSESAKLVQLKLMPELGSPFAEDYICINFWIDMEKLLPSRIVAENTNEDLYTFEFKKPQLNKNIDSKIFQYIIPEGFTTVIEQLEE